MIGIARLQVLAVLMLTTSAVVVPAQQPAAPVRPGRAAVERLAAAVQRQLGLTTEQATRLRASTREFAAERDRLNRDERVVRLELRAAVMAGDSTNQPRIARLLDDLVRVQRRRVDLLANEQTELASFLTPLQRARFLALQERALRAAQQARARREGRELPPEVPDSP